MAHVVTELLQLSVLKTLKSEVGFALWVLKHSVFWIPYAPPSRPVTMVRTSQAFPIF